jgi:hypothetical protein
MKLKLSVLLWLLLSCINIFAQNSSKSFEIKGLLLDSLTKESEPYATINVTRKDSTAKSVKMFVTDGKGHFDSDIQGDGEFVVTISSLGRVPVVKNIMVKSGDKLVDMGTLYIHSATKELTGVEVVAQKPLVKADIDKIEYSIQDDPDSKTNSLLEMLRKVPLVTVDGEDKIKVNGSSSFKVFVNGKPNSLMSNNPTEVLKSMPANSVKKIEVITNPGPKYDAEGIGGILNIITEGRGMEGYTVTLSGNVGNQYAGSGAFGTVQKGKLTVSANYEYSYNNSQRSYNGGSRKITGAVTETSSNVDYNGDGKSHGNFQSGSIEASYDIDTLRLVSMSFGLWGGGNRSSSSTSVTATAPLTGDELYRYTSVSPAKSSWYSIDGGIDYQRLFHVKDRMFTLSYKINTDPNTSHSYYDYNDKNAATDWQDFVRRMTDQHDDGSQNTTEQTFQADYTTPFKKIHTLQTGVKYILRNNRSDNDRYTMPEGGDYTFDEDHSSHYKHRNDIFAAYLGYALKVKKISARLGLRYEHTLQDVKYLLGRGENFTKNFDDMVPSASIGYKLSDFSNFNFSYNLRIYRPGIWYLNPYIDDSDPTNISQGNSNLTSEKNHSLTLTYSSFTQKLTLNVSMRYSFTNNSIENFSSLVKDTEIDGLQNPTGKSVMYNTYRNIGSSRNATMSGYVNWNPNPNTRIYTNLSGGYSYLNDGKDISNHGWNMFAYGGIQQTLSHDWRIGVNFFGQTPWIMLQGKGSSYYDYGVNVTKTFLNKRLSISAYANNFFKKYMKSTYTTENTNFVLDNWNRYSRQRFGISVSFRIGELSASVKKAEHSISNDDVKSGSGGSGNGGGK